MPNCPVPEESGWLLWCWDLYGVGLWISRSDGPAIRVFLGQSPPPLLDRDFCASRPMPSYVCQRTGKGAVRQRSAKPSSRVSIPAVASDARTPSKISVFVGGRLRKTSVSCRG